MSILGRWLLLAAIGSSQALYAKTSFPIPKLKRVGLLKLEVIAQTKPQIAQVKGNKALVKQFYIAKWGIHRFEYGVVEYLCTRGRCEMLNEPTRLAMFEECSGFKNNLPVCKNLIASCDDLLGEQLGEEARHPWYLCDDPNSTCSPRDSLEEYPPRHPIDPDLGGLAP